MVSVGHCKGCMTWFSVQPNSQFGEAYCSAGCEETFRQRTAAIAHQKRAAYSNPTGTKEAPAGGRVGVVEGQVDLGAFSTGAPVVDPQSSPDTAEQAAADTEDDTGP